MMHSQVFLVLIISFASTSAILNKNTRAAVDGGYKSSQFPRMGLEGWLERFTIPSYFTFDEREIPPLIGSSFDDPLMIFSQDYSPRTRDSSGIFLSRGRGQCDLTINQEETWIASPNYPQNYDDNTQCIYSIKRLAQDVCEIEITFDDFNLEDSRPNCDSDYFDPGNGNKMCGSLVPDLKIRVPFANEQSFMTAIFKSNHRRTRKGFMAKVRQIRNSCKGVFRTNINNGYPSEDESYSDIAIKNSVDFHPKSSQCDMLITKNKGYIQSPRYPGPYGPNSVCIYTIQRSSPDVCKVELRMRKFDVLSKASRDQLCTDYLELPDRRKLCGKLNDRITIDFSKYSDNVVLMFKSGFGSSAGGFDIDVVQLPNSCYSSDRGARKCDQRIRSYSSKVVSPNYPWSYQPNTFCMYTVEPADSRMCYFSIEFNKFELDGITGYYDDMCKRDYFQLPDGHRICSNHTGKKTYMFPSGANRVAAFYFSSDERAQGPGYDLTIRQHSCDETMNPPYEDTIRPMTTCDQFVSKERDMILSPGYPNDYSPGLTCQYSILKFADDVCYLRVKFITFDVEDHPECRSDYLLIDSTGEKLCGTGAQGTRADKLIPFSSDRSIRMKFVSDSQVSRGGFKLLIEQVRNSCLLSPDMIIGLPDGPTFPASAMNPAIPFGRPSSIIPSVPPRICNFTASSHTTFYSDNYPNAYRNDVDCVYRVYRSGARVCSVEIFFREFSVGTWENRNCVNDFLKVGQLFYCGYRKNERLITEFPPGLDFIDLRFYTDSSANYPGFALDIRQLDTCRPGHSISGDRRGRKLPADQGVEITQVVDSVTPSSGSTGPFCGTKDIRSETFDIISANYDRLPYDKWTDCHYKIHKVHYTVCALEVNFMTFALEDSPDCKNDFLQFGKDGVKLCGRLPKETTRTFEFTGDEMEIKFHADGQIEDAGFFIAAKQIKC